MPTYEYACSACQHQWEEIQKISEAPIEVCPSCGKQTARRQISGGNFILKGGGWYADLYASSPKKANGEAKNESKSETKSETKSEAKAEAKPAAPASGSGSSSS